MDNEQMALQKIIRSAIIGQPLVDFPQVDTEKLFKLATKHSLQVLTYFTLLNNSLCLDSLQKLKKAVYKSILKADLIEQDGKDVLETLKRNDVKCISLKGYNIKELYPSKEMRFSLDYDCLIEKSNLKKVKKLFLDKGYIYHGQTAKHLEMISPNGTLIEFHTQLFERFLKQDFVDELFFSNVQNLSYGQNYLITLAHLASHFLSGGVGIRNIIDLYLLNKVVEDRVCLQENIAQIGLEIFNQNLQKLAVDLFENASPTEFSQELMEFVYQSDYLGGQDQKELFALAKSYNGNLQKAKKSSLINKIFPPYKYMVGIYPSLSKCPILLPIYHLRRYVTILFKRRKNLDKLKKFNSYTEQEVIKVNKILTQLELVDK